jgi:tetratricopeptide (TPR) repeat protein
MSSRNFLTPEFVRDNIVKILNKTEEFYGTGFFIERNEKKYCITCHHCICKLDQIFVGKGNTKYLCKWEEEYSDMAKDIAVLSLENDTGSFNTLAHNAEMLPLLDVFVWGYSSDWPEGEQEKGKLFNASQSLPWPEENIRGDKKWNKKPRVDVFVYKFNGTYKLGFSGGPVCYEGNNKVIGIFGAKDKGYGYVIPIETLLKKFIKDKSILQPHSNIDVSQYLEKGNTLYQDRRFDDAIKQYDEIIDDINYLSALSNKGKCLVESGQNTKAIELFNVVLQVDPNFIHALNGMSDALNLLGRFNEAIEFCDKALKIDPNDASTLASKGDSLNYLERARGAVEWYDKALKIDPNFANPLSSKGYTLSSLGKYDEAIEWYDKALKIDPDYIHALNGKGLALTNLGKYDEAIEWYDKALKIDPDYIYAISLKGYALHSLGKYDEAIEWYDKALKIDPDYIYAIGLKGYALHSLGKYDEAIEWYDKSLKINPNDAITLSMKKQALEKLGRS